MDKSDSAPEAVARDVEKARSFQRVMIQAHRYLVAVYGKDVVYRAPETLSNVLERWIKALSAGNMDFADEQMTKIEEMADENRQRQYDRETDIQGR